MFTSRISRVDRININTNIFSSTFQIGDSRFIDSASYVFAVQREVELFDGKEGDFNYPIFTAPFHLPTIFENINTEIYHDIPFINVEFINIGGIAASSILHIGNSEDIRLQARVKNIRQLIDRSDREQLQGRSNISIIQT